MDKMKQALIWALDNGARVVDYGTGDFRNGGCGCCASEIDPPRAISETLRDVRRQMLSRDKRRATLAQRKRERDAGRTRV